jgi:glycogen operon protein
MTAAEWNSGWVRCIGLYLNGKTLNDLNALGEMIVDDTFLLLLNPGHEPISFTLPMPRPGCTWEAMVDTRHPINGTATPLDKTQPYDLGPRCSALLREVVEPEPPTAPAEPAPQPADLEANLAAPPEAAKPEEEVSGPEASSPPTKPGSRKRKPKPTT